MTILFATDLSARASVAGDVAARLARSLHEPLVVFHVADPCGGIEILELEAARLERVTATEPIVRCGSVIDAIESYASESKARYVVVGAQGKTARAVLGTVATALSARLPNAVFVVRAGERMLPFLDGKEALRVVLPHARDESFVAARDALIEMSRIGPIDATIAHAPKMGETVTIEARAHLQRELRASIGPIPGVDVRVTVRDGSEEVAQRLVSVIAERNAQLVICGTHQRHGVDRFVEGSVAADLVRYATCTVMVAPTQRGSLS